MSIKTRLKTAMSAFRRGMRPVSKALSGMMPKGLYARSLLIIIVPIVILQSVIAFVFLERHWQTVTRRLSESVARDIAAIITVIETYPQDPDYSRITGIAREQLDLNIAILPPDPLPPAVPKPFFSLLDRALSEQITQRVGRPFWIDTVGRSNLVEIRIQLDKRVLRVFARRSQTYASNSHIFLMWMIGTSLVLLSVAVLFLRNQIRPIQRLAGAAEQFGKGQPIDKSFRHRGAREVRQASQAFVEMQERIERHVDQRTAMLAGVSHDLRTILTRFRLQLALFDESEDVNELRRDVDEMNAMLEGYLAFARGDEGEKPEDVDVSVILRELQSETERTGHGASITMQGDPIVHLKPAAFKRCLSNLVVNASRYASTVDIRAIREGHLLQIIIDDDGPGIPEDRHEDVFRPFVRLDQARNQDTSGTGLGLSIARDIAHAHGGNISLDASPMGGLRVIVSLPA